MLQIHEQISSVGNMRAVLLVGIRKWGGSQKFPFCPHYMSLIVSSYCSLSVLSHDT
jgi:hypothetical protein